MVIVILNSKIHTHWRPPPQTNICMGLLTQSLKMDIWKLLTDQSYANRSLEKIDFTHPCWLVSRRALPLCLPKFTVSGHIT
jgi:hypothetical protein